MKELATKGRQAHPGEAVKPDELIAYPKGDTKVEIVPAAKSREWLHPSDVQARFCTPLRMANQYGWFVLNPASFIAIWNGGNSPEDTELRFLDGSPPFAAESHFGSGVVTIGIPYLFRTAPGIGLLLRGPSNFWVDGAAPLEGLVETSWAVMNPGMNWKITRVNEPVYFPAGQPYCMIVPVSLDLVERLRPRFDSLNEDSELALQVALWDSRERSALWRIYRGEGLLPHSHGEYATGCLPSGEPSEDHRFAFKVRSFERASVSKSSSVDELPAGGPA